MGSEQTLAYEYESPASVNSIWGLFKLKFDPRGRLGQGWLWGTGAEVEAGILTLTGALVEPKVSRPRA